MSLPLLNEVPNYELKIPSTGKKIKYRPYLVKEEKVLLMANESKDEAQIILAITDTVRACTNNKVPLETLTTFDLEYLFIKIRAKSVGEKVELSLPCEECQHRNITSINLDEVVCPVVDTETTVKINDTVSVELQYPSYHELEPNEDETEAVFNIVTGCIKAVYNGDERIDIQDEPKETIRRFLESMTSKQFGLIADFVKNMPKVTHYINFDCTECGEHNEIEVKGIQNFF